MADSVRDARHLSFASSMKYELVLSMAALCDPEHHDTQMAWIRKAKGVLSESVLQRIRDIFRHSHESILLKMLSGCEGTIEAVAQHLTDLSLKNENEILRVMLSEKDIGEATNLLTLLKDASRGTISNGANSFFYEKLSMRDEYEMVSFVEGFLNWLCENRDLTNAMLPQTQRSAVLRFFKDSYRR